MTRQYFMSQLQRFYESTKAQGGDLTLAMLDIDKFKQINDTHGHLMGDSALKLFASVVRSRIRDSDLFGRYGGDEFVITFHNTAVGEAGLILERINESLRRVVLKTDSGDIALTMSSGLCAMEGETACRS